MQDNNSDALPLASTTTNVKILLHTVLNVINSTVRTLHLIKPSIKYFLLPIEVISHFC